MFEILALPFFQRAMVVGVVLGVLLALLGVFVVLRKMSFFSDALGHSALTGIALGLLLEINPFFAAVVFSLLVAIGISLTRKISKLAIDTLLGVFFSAAVALGVVLVSITPGYQADLISFLFGNILTVTRADVGISVVVAVVSLLLLFWSWKSLVAISFDPALAKAEGHPVERYELLLLLLLAVSIALSIKFVGIILVTALLVIPAATAQNIASSIMSMAWVSVVVSLVSVVIGMLASAYLQSPSGPTIVLTGTTLFAISLILRPLKK